VLERKPGLTMLPVGRHGRLADKVAIVTGATSGIGEAITRVFAREGARVLFCGRRVQNGERLKRELEHAGHDVLFVKADISRPEAVTNLMRVCRHRFGRLDILVNNAGIARAASLETTRLSDWKAMFDTNVTGMFLVLKAAIPLIRQSGGGSIINLGSTYGIEGSRTSPGYAATKAVAINLAQSLAVALATDRIRVNALCPGGTDTEGSLRWFANQPDPVSAKASEVAHYPMGRFASPAEQAEAALFLASDASSYVTGHAMVVDGGYLLG
jgi:NAD(P)-dependent dehydrogenase (short-subunit alcohol dehydrogenase family)